jgi:hypothetical protein
LGSLFFYVALIPVALIQTVLPMTPALKRFVGKGCLGGTLEGPLGQPFFVTGLKWGDIGDITFTIL